MRWTFKKDVPKHLQRMAVQVRFRWARAWIVRDENGRVMFECGMADCFDFYLKTPGHVIGLRDLETAQSYPWADEWRQAMHARIREHLMRMNGISPSGYCDVKD